LGSFFQNNAHSASEKLAKTKGCFPNWKGSKWDTEHNRQMRNAGVTTIAPTGSISIIASCNGGIEPIFSLAYKRRALDNQEFIELHPIIEKMGREQGWLSEDIRKKLIDGIHPKNISEIPPEVSQVLVTAHEVSPDQHVRIQATFQKNIDNAISKTVNLPTNASVGDVDRIFRLAHQLGCKGVTVYRDGCRNNQIISSSHNKSSKTSDLIQPRSISRKTKGETTKYNIGCGKLYVSVNQDEHGLCEVFANLGKAGGCPAQSEATCRIASAAIRCGVDPKVLIGQLKGIRCLSTISQRKIDKNIDALKWGGDNGISIAVKHKGIPGFPEFEGKDTFTEILKIYQFGKF
jgi:ribonucleoside-diphosphate reductase alpha chain